MRNVSADVIPAVAERTPTVSLHLHMLAALFVLRPGFLSPSAGLKFADIPNGLAAVSKVPVAGWAQIAAYFGFVEFSGGFDDYKTGTPGDYGFKVLTSSDPAEKTKKLSAELANGRLAMMAIIGMFFQASCNMQHVSHDKPCSPVSSMRVVTHDMSTEIDFF